MKRGKRRGKRYSVRFLRQEPNHALSIVETPSMRPAVRGGCEHASRPCPFVSCRHHLAMDVLADGALRFPHGHEPEDLARMVETCALDVAQDGGRCVNEVADLLGLSRQRTAQLEVDALRKLKAHIDANKPKGIVDAMPYLAKLFAKEPDDC